VVFPTIEFAIFFTVVLALSWALMPWPALWKPFILAASAVFYGAASWNWVALLVAVILANQAAAVAIAHVRVPRGRSAIMAAAVAADLGLLGLFKYYDFFVQDAGRALDAVNLGMPVPLLSLALPVGISFFVFQAISYVVDVKRGLLEPARTVDVAIYLGFFPHLVAGPIVRAREFLPQLASPRNPRDVAVGGGVVLICVGLVKKVVLADLLARQIVDPVFAVPELYHTPDALLAAYAYTAQIYCDFSGYTDIAIGLALLMGFVFPKNFASPYRSTSVREFWRRWHITLSRYLRDFLYIPLGGNRGGRWRTARNLMVTMLLGGLWHGAAWTFVLWGGLHGAMLCVEHFAGERRMDRIPAWLRWLVVFHIIVFGWILFRSPDLGVVGAFLGAIASPGAATLVTPLVVIAVIVVIGGQLLPPRPLDAMRLRLEALPWGALGAALAVVILVVASTVPSQGVPPFIYFQF
jgi:D-alanyl-lipoteichoic acid acyltransferase DltB (MBOAT superfamily)